MAVYGALMYASGVIFPLLRKLMAEKTYNWNTEPVKNLSNDSEWQKFVEGATKERIRKERKAELDKQKNENADGFISICQQFHFCVLFHYPY